jgi:hypothetical protein
MLAPRPRFARAPAVATHVSGGSATLRFATRPTGVDADIHAGDLTAVRVGALRLRLVTTPLRAVDTTNCNDGTTGQGTQRELDGIETRQRIVTYRSVTQRRADRQVCELLLSHQPANPTRLSPDRPDLAMNRSGTQRRRWGYPAASAGTVRCTFAASRET